MDLSENIKYLDKIKSPEDLKKLNKDEINVLTDEIRTTLIDTVSRTGGHLASNLGVVELTIAIHLSFDSPKDRIVWDVGHQAYVHKLLTGRYDKFDTLRQEGGISGFCHPNESEHDTFYSGHSGTSISSAYGIAQSNKIKKNNNYTVAVIGDGSFTGGLVYEALNNAGRTNTQLIVILNDNEMSISRNVGSVAKYLTKIRSKKRYVRMKAGIEKALDKIPVVGNRMAVGLFNVKTRLKNFFYESTLFEKMGFRYMGPIDGYNIDLMCEALETAKTIKKPVLLHVNTVKGKGYDFAEKDPSHFHGVSNFKVETGKSESKGGTTFCNEFGHLMCDMAQRDKRITLITAAMSLGTGLTEFSENYSERFFDVGIAEEHAVTFASGLSKGGMLPVFAVYSTFLQRCYDEIVHDGALQDQKMVLAIDRAGFVGDDGETHNGLYDVSFLQSIPNVTIYSPSTYDEMKIDFGNAFYRDKDVVAVRYPRGGEAELPEDFTPSFGTYDIYGNENADITIVTYGRLFGHAAKAVNELKEKNISVKVLKLNCIKPIDKEAVEAVINSSYIFFYEEGVRSGGTGEKLAATLLEHNYKGRYKLTAVEDCFVKQATVESQIKSNHLDCESMIDDILKEVELLSDKLRLDMVLTQRGLAASREKAKALIMAGQVYVNGQKELKAGTAVKPDDSVEVRGSQNPFVSRGGLKLQKAAQNFDISLENCICMDIGASTGGFTDCMLSHGAKKVYAIDVGYGQLAWKLRTDERVVNMERTNFRYVTHEQIPEEIDFASVDVSFISLKIILPVLRELLKNDGEAVCLIKPQFEAGREKIGKKGVVRDPEVHIEVVKTITAFALECGFGIKNLDFSPIKGPEGNIEYLIHIFKTDEPEDTSNVTPEDLVKMSHSALDKTE